MSDEPTLSEMLRFSANGLENTDRWINPKLPDLLRTAATELDRRTAPLSTDLPVDAVREATRRECIAILQQKKAVFLDPAYAANQPFSSMAERFAIDQCIDAIKAATLGNDLPVCENSALSDPSLNNSTSIRGGERV